MKSVSEPWLLFRTLSKPFPMHFRRIFNQFQASPRPHRVLQHRHGMAMPSQHPGASQTPPHHSPHTSIHPRIIHIQSSRLSMGKSSIPHHHHSTTAMSTSGTYTLRQRPSLRPPQTRQVRPGRWYVHILALTFLQKRFQKRFRKRFHQAHLQTNALELKSISLDRWSEMEYLLAVEMAVGEEYTYLRWAWPWCCGGGGWSSCPWRAGWIGCG